MAQTRWYLNLTTADGWAIVDQTADTANTYASGWVVGTGSTNSSEFQSTGGDRASSTFTANTVPDGTLDTTLKDAFRSANPINGDFAAGNWTFQFEVRGTVQSGAADGQIVFRVIKANADGSSATEITSAQQAASVVTNVTTTDLNSSATIALGAFTVTNQYLFIQVAWKRTGAGGMTTTNVRLRTGSSTTVGTTGLTADFTNATVTTGFVYSSAHFPLNPSSSHFVQTATTLTSFHQLTTSGIVVGQSISGHYEWLSRIDLMVDKVGSPTGNVYIEVRQDSWTGPVIGTSNQVAASGFPTTNNWVTFTFSTPFLLRPDSTYYVQILSTVANASNYPQLYGTFNTGQYEGGISLNSSGAAGPGTIKDFFLRLFGSTQDVGPTVVNTTQGVTAAFIAPTSVANAPPNVTSLFVEGAHIASTVQAPPPIVNVEVAHIASTEMVFEPTIAPGEVTGVGTTIASTVALYEPTVALIEVQSVTTVVIDSTVVLTEPVVGIGIALDATTDGGLIAGGTSPLTWAHTCAGTDRCLIVALFGGDASGPGTGNDDITSVTYDAVALSLLGKVLTPGDRYVYLYGVVAPNTGTHNIVASSSSTNNAIAGQAVSYTGVKQSGLPDAVATNTGNNVTNVVATLTSIAAGCWTVMATKNPSGVASAGTETTTRQSSANGLSLFDSGGAEATGSNSLQATRGSTTDWGAVIVSLAPVGISLPDQTITTEFIASTAALTEPTVAADLAGAIETATIASTALVQAPEVIRYYTYSHKVALTVQASQIDGTLTDYPALISHTFAPWKDVTNGGRIGTIVTDTMPSDWQPFADSALTQPLQFEHLSWNHETGFVAAYVKMPSIANGTTIYIGYGNVTAATCLWNGPAVWMNGFAAVYHNTGSNAASYYDNPYLGGTGDSTIYARNFTSYVVGYTQTGTVDGGMAMTFNGSSQYAFRNGAVVTEPPLTVEAWVKPSSLTGAYILAAYNSAGASNGFFLYQYSDGVLSAGIQQGVSTYAESVKSGISTSAWCHVAGVTVSAAERTAYVNGVAGTTDTTSLTPALTPDNLTVGVSYFSSVLAGRYTGAIDEVRVSSVARSAAWLGANYRNQGNVAAFWVLGSEMPVGIYDQAITTTAIASTVVMRDPWIQRTYDYVVALTVQSGQVSGTVTNFVALINHTFAPWKSTANGGHITQTDGGWGLPADWQVFADSGLSTALTFELVYWDPTTGNIKGWIKTPVAVGTTVYIAYGNPSKTWYGGSNWQTWNGIGFTAVYHLDELQSTLWPDWLGVYHLTNNSATATAGLVEDAADFNGATSASFGPVSGGPGVTAPPLTITALIKPDVMSGVVMALLETSGAWNGHFLQVSSDSITATSVRDNFAGVGGCTAAGITVSVWNHIAGVWAASNNRLAYANGVVGAIPSTTTVVPDATPNNFTLGGARHGNTYDNFFDGVIDEVRVHNVARSAEWIAADSRSQRTPTTFWVLGSEVPVGAGDQAITTTAIASTTIVRVPVVRRVYDYVVPLTVQPAQVTGTVTQFVAYLNHTFLPWRSVANGGHIHNTLSSLPADLRVFADINQTIPLKAEWISWNPATGQLVGWIQTPVANGTTIYIGYGNASDTSYHGDAYSTWDVGFAAVYHMDALLGGVWYDFPFNNNLTNAGGTAVAGLIEGGAEFNGTTAYAKLGIGLPMPVAAPPLTISCWIKPTGLTGRMVVALLVKGGVWNGFYLIIPGISTNLQFVTVGNNFASLGEATKSGLTASVWQHVAGVTASSTSRIAYINGVAGTENTTSAAPTVTPDSITVGAAQHDSTVDLFFGGLIDELRLHSVARSPEWLEAEFHSQDNPTAFWILGSESYVTDQAITTSFIASTTILHLPSLAAINYAYKVPLVVQAGQVSGTITQFVARFDLTVLAWRTVANGGVIYNDVDGFPGDWQIFLDEALTQPTPFDVYDWGTSSGHMNGWVYVPSVAVGTTLWIAYSDPLKTTYDDAAYLQVWDLAGIVAAYPFIGPFGSTWVDMSGHGNDLTNVNGTGTTGLFDSAASFNGTTAYARKTSTVISAPPFTITGWIKGTTLATGAVWSMLDGTSNVWNGWYASVLTGPGRIQFQAIEDDYTVWGNVVKTGLTAGVWGHIGMVAHSSSSRYAYVNGVPSTEDTVDVNPTAPSSAFAVAAVYDLGGPSEYFAGLLDEFHIHNVARSHAWIEAEYNCYVAPAVFWGLGSEVGVLDQTVSGEHIASTLQIFLPTVTEAGATSVGGETIASTATLTEPSVVTGPVTVDGATITATAIINQPTAAPGAVTIVTTFIGTL